VRTLVTASVTASATVTATLALLLGGLAPAAPAASAAAPSAASLAAPLASTGYVLGGASDALIARDAHGLATLGVDGVSLARNGRSVSAPDGDLTDTYEFVQLQRTSTCTPFRYRTKGAAKYRPTSFSPVPIR